MLKHLGNFGIQYLTNIYNNSVNKAHIPASWKKARIIPLLKPGKPADKGTSFRPISLLSPSIIILESILLPTISESVKLKEHQHGFRKGHSTGTALQNIANHITTGLNRKRPAQRTVLVAIDLSKAFDTVNHEILIQDILELNLNQHIKRFLSCYLRGRQTYVDFRGSRSKSRKMNQGVPQGGVLSPTLFNLYMAKMPSPPGNIKVETYADDTTALNSGVDIDKICTELNIYLDTLKTWFSSRNLGISPTKSSATLFTTWGNEKNKQLNIKIDNESVPTTTTPKILGCTLDSMWKFGPHIQNLKQRTANRTNILKSLAGSTWGKDKEVLKTTWKATGQSLLNYCNHIYTPVISDTNWNKLQVSQNAALRAATGCVKMTPIGHLHAECKEMPVRDHCNMLSTQYLLRTQLPGHPNYTDLGRPPDNHFQLNRKTLSTEFGNKIKNMIPDNNLTEESYKKLNKKIHTDAVKETINSWINPVLDSKPPDIDVTERTLPRKTRTTLAQLRSGYSPFLKQYMHRIQKSDSDLCPDCNIAVHTTQHLFTCRPTNLTPLSLWRQPREAAYFLGLPLNEENDDDDV